MSSLFVSVKLKDISKIFSGNSINEKVKDEKYSGLENGIEYISTKDISFESIINYDNGIKIPLHELDGFKRAPKHTVFICAEGGSAGRKIAISDRELCFVNKLFAIVAGEKILPKYIFYSLQSEEFVSSFKSSMTGIIGGVSLNKFKELEIKVPPFQLQQKIVAKLDAIFVDIDKAAAATKANVANADLLFSSFLNRVFNEDWTNAKTFTLGDVCKFYGGAQPPKSFFEYQPNDSNIRFIQIRDYKSDKNIVYIPKKLAKRFCEPEDVMIGRYGPPVFQILRGIRGSYNVALMKVIPNNKLLNNDYLYFFLQNPLIQNYVISLSNRAAGQSGLNKETIEPYEIHLPSINDQIDAVQRIYSCLEHCEAIKRSSLQKFESLASLKQSILQRALNGELVKE